LARGRGWVGGGGGGSGGSGGEGVAEGLEIEGADFGLVDVFIALPLGVGKLDLNALAFEGNALGFVGLTLAAG